MTMEEIDVMEGIDFKANKEKYAKIEKRNTFKKVLRIIGNVLLTIAFIIVFYLIDGLYL